MVLEASRTVELLLDFGVDVDVVKGAGDGIWGLEEDDRMGRYLKL